MNKQTNQTKAMNDFKETYEGICEDFGEDEKLLGILVEKMLEIVKLYACFGVGK